MLFCNPESSKYLCLTEEETQTGLGKIGGKVNDAIFRQVILLSIVLGLA